MSTPYQDEEVQGGLTAAAVAQQGSRVSWGGVWSGLLVAIGVFLLLTVLGLAIGISAADVGPGEDLNARSLGIGAAVWSGLTLLIALFIGGFVATSTGMVYDRTNGMIEGVLVWVLTLLLLIYMASSGISMLTSGVLGALGSVTRGAASAAATGFDAAQLSSGDVDQVISRLRNPQTVEMVATATGLPQSEAQSTLSNIAQRIESVRNDPAQAAAEARRGAQEIASMVAARAERAAAQAQPYASASMWSTLLALVLALAAAVVGAMAGRKRVARRLTDVAVSSAAADTRTVPPRV
ncbi:hypothetical protein [Ramlibacter rhizophilus]|uniref:PhnA-like protein n=1 Tax=Ramlibacter rhizophilus TaxID=1781167 RepID=A0A4Z0C2K0_9BURK|nr:hypothetical protein [Ramlibacter rhizophilus]TFZ04445.1 hypothetical protein EZ242_01445 [Ramlibacter rhizophilus]